jgi:antitoxin component YwqK of YwqJK toxin-antitoxin module
MRGAHVFWSMLMVVAVVSCGRPKEANYDQLAYESRGALAFFKDPQTGEGFTGLAKQIDKKGTVTAEFPMKKGLFHGNVREWYGDGTPKSETEFKNGERQGRNIEWTADGKVYHQRVYDRDKIVSETKPQ